MINNDYICSLNNNRDPWQQFKNFGGDKYIVCALGGVEVEVTRLVLGRVIK
jgi:hypothetical protein